MRINKIVTLEEEKLFGWNEILLGMGLLVSRRDLNRLPICLKGKSGCPGQDLLSIFKKWCLGLTWFTSPSPPPAEDFNLPASLFDWSFGVLRDRIWEREQNILGKFVMKR